MTSLRLAAVALVLMATTACLGAAKPEATPALTPVVERPTAGSSASPASPTKAPSPAVTPGPPDLATMPPIDAHFNADDAWDLAVLLRLMDALVVGMAGSGSSARDGLALEFVAARPERFFAFARLDSVHRGNLTEGGRS